MSEVTMSTNDSNDWVKEGTPREDWDVDTDYGVEVDPAEWDDYSEEQAVPVPTPAAAKEYRPPVEPAEEPETVMPPLDEGEPFDEPSQAGTEEVLGAEPVPEGEEPAQEPLIAAADPVRADDEPPLAAEEPPVVPERGIEPEHQPTADIPEGDVPAEPAGESPVLPGDRFVGGSETAEELETDVEATQVRPRPTVVDQPDEAQTAAFTPVGGETEPPEADVDPAPAASAIDDDEPEPTEATAQFSPFQAPEQDEALTREEREDVALDYEQDAPPEDDRPTREGGAAVAGAAGGAGFASLYRDDIPQSETEAEETQAIEAAEETQAFGVAPEPSAPERTQVIDQSRLQEEQAAEEARMARLQEQRDARDARLGVVPGSEANNVRVVEQPVKRQSDKFFGAFTLFLLRLVTAFVIGVLGYQVLQDVDAATEALSGTVIPEPRLVAWILGFALASMAVLLVLGLGVRIVGVVLVVLAAASLAVLRWGQFSIFQDGLEGFLGDRTLMTAAVGFVLAAFGSGRWGIDGAIRAARDKSKSAQGQ